jgi:hypothetical protein
MPCFAIIEVEEGLTVAEVPPHSTAEETAALRGARVVDPGPYETYEDVYDSMMAITDRLHRQSVRFEPEVVGRVLCLNR